MGGRCLKVEARIALNKRARARTGKVPHVRGVAVTHLPSCRQVQRRAERSTWGKSSKDTPDGRRCNQPWSLSPKAAMPMSRESLALKMGTRAAGAAARALLREAHLVLVGLEAADDHLPGTKPGHRESAALSVSDLLGAKGTPYGEWTKIGHL